MGFKMIVMVKQVPDTEALVQIADDGTSIKTRDIKWVMNPYDELAVEEAPAELREIGRTLESLDEPPPAGARARVWAGVEQRPRARAVPRLARREGLQPFAPYRRGGSDCH